VQERKGSAALRKSVVERGVNSLRSRGKRKNAWVIEEGRTSMERKGADWHCDGGLMPILAREGGGQLCT